MPLDISLTAAGAVSAALLIAGLFAGIAAGQDESRWRIWPAPPVRSLKSFAFWCLFRTLNIAVLALSAHAIFVSIRAGQLTPVRAVLTAASLAAFAAYLSALWALGREATYCRASGLATRGVYRWTRNPQYATAIVAYSALGLAAWSPAATALAAALVLVYALMALAEEPWLEARYGRAYRKYRSEVPRFFNMRHAVGEIVARTGRASRPIASRRRNER